MTNHPPSPAERHAQMNRILLTQPIRPVFIIASVDIIDALRESYNGN